MTTTTTLAIADGLQQLLGGSISTHALSVLGGAAMVHAAACLKIIDYTTHSGEIDRIVKRRATRKAAEWQARAEALEKYVTPDDTLTDWAILQVADARAKAARYKAMAEEKA